MKALPSLNKLYADKKNKGLHIFIVYAQDHPREEVEKFLADRECKVPCPYTGSDFGGYRDGWSGLPYGFVIGPDAKIVWEGRSGYEAVIEKQLERIKYPGLGKLEVNSECVKAAEKFGGGDFAGAREEAVKVKEKEADNEAAVADAEYIIKRVDEKIESLRAKIDDAKEKRRYLDALRYLEELAGKGFKGMEAADKAKDEAKELKKEQKDEIKAWEQLEKTLEVNEKVKSDADRKKNLIKFYEKYEGTAAAEEAKAMVGGLSD